MFEIKFWGQVAQNWTSKIHVLLIDAHTATPSVAVPFALGAH